MKLGLLSDAHGNLPAFELGLRYLEREKVDQVYFLGDSIGYFADPGVVKALRRMDMRAVMGNHEAMLASPPEDREPIYQLSRCRNQLNDAEVEWLTSLPEQLILRVGDVEVRLCHGAPDNPVYGYIYPDADLNDFNLVPGVIYASGNTHWPMSRISDSGALFCNPGSCGLPRDRGDLGAVGILDVKAFEFRVIRYDIAHLSIGWANHCAPTHQSIYDLFRRSSAKDFYGEYQVE